MSRLRYLLKVCLIPLTYVLINLIHVVNKRIVLIRDEDRTGEAQVDGYIYIYQQLIPFLVVE